MTDHPTVFISYAHEGDLAQSVFALAEWLSDQGVKVVTDYPYRDRPPEEGWRAWMQHGIEDADFVLVVCTERYKSLFEKRGSIPEGGFGASWEGAILAGVIYQDKMRNNRIFPILRDDGDPAHIPAVLKDWDNNHRFPSGRDRILSLIREQVVLLSPKMPFQQRPPGEISDGDDARLQPREGEVLGREHEINEVAAFLGGTSHSATVCGHVTGSGGIGKTEVCKAALKQWLGIVKPCRAFWVPVTDDADAARLLQQLGEAVGLTQDTLTQITEFSQLRMRLPSGLYYLDNLEHVAESEGGRKLLRALGQTSGLRILASSRVALDGVLGGSITIDRLDTDAACALFMKCWTGKTVPDHCDVRSFVDDELDGHALSITLVARLGRAFGWDTLPARWRDRGTALAATRNPTDRLDSLEISFALTCELLVSEPGALDLWQFIALFPDGISEEILAEWTRLSGHELARVALAEHHLVSVDRGSIRILSPIARYALDHAIAGETGSETRFDWIRARQLAYRYFMSVAKEASSTISSTATTESRTRSAEQMWAIECLLKTDVRTEMPDYESMSQLHVLLRNVYSFCVLPGRATLRLLSGVFSDGMTKKRLGDLESRLGNVEMARSLFEEAVVLCRATRDDLGLAEVLTACVHLESRLGHLDQARLHCGEAITICRRHDAWLGLANVLKYSGDLEYRTGNLEQCRAHYDEAIALYRREQNELGLANALLASANMEVRLGNLQLGRDCYAEAIELYQREQDKLGLANTLIALGRLDHRLGDAEQCRRHCQDAIALCENVKDGLALANAHMVLGDLELHLDNWDQSRRQYEYAIELYRSESVGLGVATALRSLGNLELRLGNVEHSRRLYEEAAALYRSEQDNLGLANTLRLAGDLELNLNNLDEAHRLYENSAELYRKAQDRLGLAHAFKSLGDVNVRLGRREAGRHYYDQAITLHQLEQNDLGLANTFAAVAQLHNLQGEFQEAYQYYNDAVPLYRRIHEKLGLANVLRALGDLELSGGNLKQCRQYYDEALTLQQQQNNALGEANTWLGLGDLERQLGNPVMARNHYAAAEVLFQSKKSELGLADVYQSLGDLNFDTNASEALGYYLNASRLYRINQNPMAARCLADVIRCKYRLHQLPKRELIDLGREAMANSSHLGIEAITSYVMQAFLEVCDGSELELKAVLEEISLDQPDPS